MESKSRTSKGTGFPCAICKRTFEYKSKLTRHELVHSKIKQFKCCYCSKAFSLLYNLKVHTRIHTGQRPYKCKYLDCNKSFAQSNNLKVHIKKYHQVCTTQLPSYILEILKRKEEKIERYEEINDNSESETTLGEFDFI